jgi:hypothetical protein
MTEMSEATSSAMVRPDDASEVTLNIGIAEYFVPNADMMHTIC